MQTARYGLASRRGLRWQDVTSFRPGDWESAAVRLDEIISAHSGEDPFEEALKLLVAKLAHESSGAAVLTVPGRPTR